MIRSVAAVALVAGAGAAFGIEARTLGQITFEPCRLTRPGSPAFAEAQCARFEVAENPDEPDGRRIALHLALVPAAVSQPAPDPVVLLAGGPGQAASEAYVGAAPAFAELRKSRQILLVDQRGTGKSNRLFCPLPDWKTTGSLSAAESRRMAEGCRRELEPRADLRFYTTSDYIRDLESVREAIGSPRFNLAGGSYGTRVALEYLRRHPDAIRSVFIDSVVPPELALGQEHARNLEEALAKMAARCRAGAACRDRFGDPLRTLHAVKAQAAAKSAPVRYRHPATHEWTGALFTADLVGVVARLYSYAPETLALLPLLAHEARQGRPETLLAQAEMVMQWAEDSLAHGMELSVICAEDEPWLKANPADAQTLMGGDIVEHTKAQCAVWLRGKVPPDFKQPVVSDKPVLLLSGELDPVTPPRYAEQVAKTLANSRHFVARGQGHTPMGEGCMPRLLAEFVDSLNPKELDGSCLDALGDTPFFLNFAGPAP